MRLDALTPIFAQAAVGDFSQDIVIPDNDDKFTELYVGIQVMLDVIRDQTREMQLFNQELSDQIALQTEALHKQNRLLETTLKSIGDAIVVVDINAKPVIMNPAAEKLLGPTLLLGTRDEHSPYGVFHSDMVIPYDDNARPVMRAIHGEATDGIEMFIKNQAMPLGVFVTASGQPLLDEAGKVFGGVVVYRDISVHKQLEAELREYTQELEDKVNQRTAELEQYLLVLHKQEVQEKAVLESIGDGVIAIDQERNILFVNQAAEQMLEKRSVDMIGKPFLTEVPAYNEKGELISDRDRPFELAINEGKVVNGKYFYMRKNGIRFPVAVTVSPIILAEKFIGLVNSFRDITREIQIDQAKNELVSLASHQLRTPPTGIKWYTGMLLAEEVGPVTKEQRSYLEEILYNNQRMIDVVNAMLDVSRIELGTLTIEAKPTNVPALIEGLLKELALQIELKRLVIEKKYAEDEPPALAQGNDFIHINAFETSRQFFTVLTLSLDICCSKGINLSQERQDWVISKAL